MKIRPVFTRRPQIHVFDCEAGAGGSAPVVQIESEIGSRYVLERSASPAGPWQSLGTSVNRTGRITLPAPSASTGTSSVFYRFAEQ